jgi:hypothetical protein
MIGGDSWLQEFSDHGRDCSTPIPRPTDENVHPPSIGPARDGCNPAFSVARPSGAAQNGLLAQISFLRPMPGTVGRINVPTVRNFG